MGGKKRTLWYELPHQVPASEGDAVFCTLLPLAMARGENLRLSAPVHPNLLRNADKIQNEFKRIQPHLNHVKIHAPKGRGGVNSNGVTACTFTGGIDSFYAVLTSQNDPEGSAVRRLLYVHGFDVPLASPLSRLVEKQLLTAAEDLALPLEFVFTNLRELTDESLDWLYYHAAALAATGHLMAS